MPTSSIPRYRHYLREWRVARGLTTQDLADRIGTSRGMISRYETGERGLTLEVQFALMEALGITPAEFFSDPADQAAVVTFPDDTPEQRELKLRMIRAMIKS